MTSLGRMSYLAGVGGESGGDGGDCVWCWLWGRKCMGMREKSPWGEGCGELWWLRCCEAPVRD